MKFNQSDDTFEVLGGLHHFSDIDTGNARVIIYNLTASGTTANAYHGDNSAELGASSSATIIKLDPAYKFPYPSPYQRFFIVDEPISYKIEGDELRRYSGYTIDDTPGPPNDAPSALVAKHLSLSDSTGTSVTPFKYHSATSNRSGLVTIRLILEDKGEYIQLLHQVHVDNAP